MNRLIFHQLIKNLLLKEIEQSESEYAPLKVTSFQDRDTRVKTLIRKLKKSEALTLQKGSVPVIIKTILISRKSDPKDAKPLEFNSTNFDDLINVLPKLNAYDKITLIDDKNVRYPITAFAKTIELGGLGRGGTLKPERAAIKSIQEQLTQIGEPITIVFNGVEYTDIDTVIDVKGNQKADFAFAAGDKAKLFASYKPGTSASSIIAYGGITAISEKSRDVQSFVAAVRKQVPDFKEVKKEFTAPLNDKNVILRAMYGSDFGSQTYSDNNVQALLQGDIKLELISGNKYKIVASHTIIAPEIPDGPYTPVLNARYANDRNQFDIMHCRVSVLPQDARKNAKTIVPQSNKQQP